MLREGGTISARCAGGAGLHNICRAALAAAEPKGGLAFKQALEKSYRGGIAIVKARSTWKVGWWVSARTTTLFRTSGIVCVCVGSEHRRSFSFKS